MHRAQEAAANVAADRYIHAPSLTTLEELTS